MRLSRSTGPTLADVAREAGVALKTASRALNNDRYINAETAAHVLSVMKQLGYQPNELARGLKARRSAAIGMIVPNLADPFTATTVQAVQEVAKSHKHVVILASTGGDPAIESVEIGTLVRRQVDGLVIAPADSRQEHFKTAIPEGIPTVCFDQPARNKSFDSITVTNQRGAREATEHLLGHGYRRILAIGARPHLYTCAQRVLGYRQAMRQAGLPDNSLLVEHEAQLTPELLNTALAALPGKDFFALLPLNWVTTVATLRALRKLGLRVGEHCALISHDDFDLAEVLTPSLTVIRQPSEEMGRIAAELLFDRIQEKTSVDSNRRITLPTKFVPRQSCGCVDL